MSTPVVSSIPAVLSWLVSSIDGLPQASGLQVSDGFPKVETALFVVVGGAVRSVETDATTAREEIGGSRRETEEYLVSIEVHSSTGSTDQASVRLAAFTVRDAVHGLVRSDPSLGGLALDAWWSSTNLTQTDEEQAPEGRVALVTGSIHVQAWLA